MVKINQEEYELLKTKLDEGYEWVTREMALSQWVRIYKRHPDTGFPGLAVPKENDKFGFIKVGDEPYSIAELIEEYEQAATDAANAVAEALKNAMATIGEALKNIGNRLGSMNTPKFTIDDIEPLLIKKSEETEVSKQKLIDKWQVAKMNTERVFQTAEYDRALKEYCEGALFAQTAFLKDLDELDEPEITEEQAYLRIAETMPLTANDIKVYLSHKVANNNGCVKKPVIPQFVADWVEETRDWALYEMFEDDYLLEEHHEIYKWIYDNDTEETKERELAVVMAKNIGYEIEEEPTWKVKKGTSPYHYFCCFKESVDEALTPLYSHKDSPEVYVFKDRARAAAVALLIDGEIEEVEE